MNVADTTHSITGRLQQLSGYMSAWMKFLGISNMLLGAFMAITIVGLLFAWLPLWIGILLYQAGERASDAARGDEQKLVEMLDKIRLYVVINSVLTMLWLAFAVGFFVFFYVITSMPAEELRGLMEYVF
ncbi:MAG: DUF5362 family protein [Calditrichota bacterium]